MKFKQFLNEEHKDYEKYKEILSKEFGKSFYIFSRDETYGVLDKDKSFVLHSQNGAFAYGKMLTYDVDKEEEYNVNGRTYYIYRITNKDFVDFNRKNGLVWYFFSNNSLKKLGHTPHNASGWPAAFKAGTTSKYVKQLNFD